jgi:hypothetical protein
MGKALRWRWRELNFKLRHYRIVGRKFGVHCSKAEYILVYTPVNNPCFKSRQTVNTG